jgi:asparagine synthase (glutamine-hydrolysing)
VAVFHRDGRAVDGALLESLTATLRRRGPDGAQTWLRGPIGLGHARFVTDPARDGGVQPDMLEEKLWIAGHVRLDGRDALAQALGVERRGATDAALVLRAYQRWGADCLAHVHGDFAFAIWDDAAQRLFCARDRFGVQPLFYTTLGELVLVGNGIDTLRAHPQVSDRLYEPALADYLAVGNPLEPDRTFFADLRRLPAAHVLVATAAGTRVERYWQLPVEPELRYRQPDEYVEHFAELLSQAVADRCSPGPVGLFMSGGLDSGAIAAILTGKLGRAPPGAEPRGFCVDWTPVFPDPEPDFARRSAAALGLPLHVWPVGDAEPFKGWDCAEGVGPEPEDDFYRANTIAHFRRAGAQARVVLNGRGGDEVFAMELLLDELRRAPRLSVLGGALALWRRGRRPPLGLKAVWRRALPEITPPPWLEDPWVRDTGLRGRLAALTRPPPPGPRARARARLDNARWYGGFDFSADAYAGLEVRYPLLDERVVAFALRLPPLPWCVDKHLLRRALAGCLPAEVLQRRKTFLAGEPLLAWTEGHPEWIAAQALAPLPPRVRATEWRRAWVGAMAPAERGVARWRLARALALARWQSLRATRACLPAVA